MNRLKTTRRLTVLIAAILQPLAGAAATTPPAGISPQTLSHFRLLEQALPRYEELARRPALTALPPLPAKSLKPGERYSGAARLRELLTALGDLPADPAAPLRGDDTLDESLVAALETFQERHGLEVDGVLGRATWQALTTPLAQRVRQIQSTLRRWRELPPNPYRRAIFINIPRFRLYALPDMASTEAALLQIDVVVGSAMRNMHTPTFAADLTHVIFRPYWDVPQGIARRELLPKAHRDAGYLDRNHYEILDGAGRRLPHDAASLAAVEAGSARIRQRPGPDNALGGVKFVMPNPHNVYLHDTPARELFSHTRRAYSHGCIRVSDPAALARFVLQDDPQWTAERIAAAMQGNAPLRVNLREPVRVYLVYGTAIAREDGSVLFLQDLYGLEP